MQKRFKQNRMPAMVCQAAKLLITNIMSAVERGEVNCHGLSRRERAQHETAATFSMAHGFQQ